MSKPQQNEIAVSVILHDVLPECHANYERWLLDAIAAHSQFEGISEPTSSAPWNPAPGIS